MEWLQPAYNVCPHGAWGEKIERFQVSAVSAFKESSKRGCAACTMILSIVEELRPHWTSTDVEGKHIRLTFEMSWSPQPLGITLQEGTEREGSFTLLCRSPAEPHYTIDNDSYHSGKSIIEQSLDIAPESGSRAALDRAKQWLSLCVDKDDVCMAPQPEFRPHRLININDASDGSSTLKLYEPQETVPYACLSYCWGTDLDGVLRTTTRNALSHYKAIESEELPKTIRDAVTVCKGLSINNLWVDSICIIQDDVEDWLRESPQMLDIYQNSLVTIYATDSDSCKSGFLGPQSYGSAQWQRRMKTAVPTGLSCPGTEFFVRDRAEEKYNDYEKPMTTTVLDRRGWCLQEGILPNRRLYYDGNEMKWECNTRIVCECGHKTTTARYDTGPLSGLREASGLVWNGFGLEQCEESSSDYHPGEDWKGIVEDYSSRSLSNPQDKLSAISGIARMMLNATKANRPTFTMTNIVSGIARMLLNATKTNKPTFTKINKPISEAYYAGLWASSFLTGLTWTALEGQDSGQRTHRRPEQYRAPTWSWASIDGPVRWAYQENIDMRKYTIVWHALVRKVRCQTLSDADPTGRLKSGYALLTAPLVAVELEQNDNNYWIYRKDLRRPRRYKVTLELEMESSTTQYNPSDEQDWGDMDVMSTQSFDTSSDRYFCLQLFSWEDHTSGTMFHNRLRRMEPKTWFLVLQRSLDGYTFERIGIGSSDAHDDPNWIQVEDGTFKIGNISLKKTTYKCLLFEGCETKTVKIA